MEQIGKDIYFDLVDHDKVRSFRIQKNLSFASVKVIYSIFYCYMLEHSLVPYLICASLMHCRCIISLVPLFTAKTAFIGQGGKSNLWKLSLGSQGGVGFITEKLFVFFLGFKSRNSIFRKQLWCFVQF